jgi:hypothetical protein
MANANDDICIRITVQNPKGQPLGGTVDLEFQPHDSGETVNVKGQDASKEIDVSGLQRTPIGLYQLTVTPTDVFKPVSQFVTIPASGSVAVTVVIDKGTAGTDGVCIVVTVHNPQGQPLGGTVDLVFTPQKPGNTVTLKAQEASREIAVSGLQRSPQGNYQLTVTPTDVAKPATQSVVIPATGFSTVTLVIDKGSGQQSGPNVVQGNLVFDNGLAAAGIMVRVFYVSFGGRDVKMGEAVSDAQGKYSITYTPPGPGLPNLQVRVLDSAGKEVTISATKYNTAQSETLNLVVPASTHPLAPEFQRLSADMQQSIGGIANLGEAQEGAARQDLTLLNQSTNWDARLVALAATAAQQTKVTGLGQDVLFALFRVGLPSDPALLATVPSAAVQQALTKANQAGIVSLNDQQISAATTAFQNFATNTLVAAKAPGAVSSFSDLLTPHFQNPAQQTAFANLYFSNPSAGAELWTQAANLQIPAATLDALKLQGKFLYLTFNNAALAGKLQQDIGSNITQLADKDYHKPATWEGTLTSLAAGGDVQSLIPAIYSGATTADRLAAYSGDLARKVRISFPTQVAARMIESNELAVNPATKANITAFLRAASSLGYSLGRTPLNTFLASSAKSLPALDDATKQSVKTLHRLYQVTPSTESLQAALSLNFTSAHDIASYSKDEFLSKYELDFPSGEAQLVYGRSQTVSSVTFNVFLMAKQLDTSAPVYTLSSSSDGRQGAKNTLVQQFPSMASLFGNLDFCECEDCRSVLSPAAYFVDVLDLLGKQSTPNAKGFTPLDVLIGSAVDPKTMPGRRPDLGALPLTCENTNTAMPYIDLVNEILEYYIANSQLDAGAAYDTGTATTADLIAEPQHILPQVYNTTLKQAAYPLNLPFDLWIETVRGFLNYFKMPLAQVLDALRPADTLELFTDGHSYSYYRAQILVESLGISPAEYAVFTVFDTTKWFNLYGAYANEAAALNDLKSAKTLSQKLGISYQDLVNLMTTGFLNPALYPLLFQFERFGIDMSDAFSFTGQPGYPTLVDTPPAHALTDFKNLLAGITKQYHSLNPAFDATTWLTNLLPANYSKKVLVLADPDTGCNFSGTVLEYADNNPMTSGATPLDFLKFNLFVRLWQKLGWTIDEVDRTLQTFFPANLPAWTDPGFAAAFGAAWKTALVYIAHLDDLNTRLAPAAGRIALLPLWTNLPTQGENPLYSQLFLTSSVLNNDFAFDDPNGQFPGLPADQLSLHQAAVQGVLSLTAAEITAILNDTGVAAPALFTLGNLSICYRYSLLAQCLQLSVSDMIALKTMSGLNPFQALSGTPLAVLQDDLLGNQTLAFAKQVAAVENSGFTVEDLQYLLRHQFDPVGKYQSDPNALIALVQSVAGGLQQVQTKNAVPPNVMTLPETLIDQILSGVIPAPILKTLFNQLTNSQIYISSQGLVASAIDSGPFTQESELTFNYDQVTKTQTVGYRGLLLNWKKTQLEAIAPGAPTAALFNGLLDAVQTTVQAPLDKSIGDLLGVWASLVQYQVTPPPLSASSGLVGTLLAMWTNNQTYMSVQTAVSNALQVDSTAFFNALASAKQAGTITAPVPALQFNYDSANLIQTLTCRGVLTDALRVQLAALLPASAVLGSVLQDVRNEAVSVFQSLATNLIIPGPTDLDTYSMPFLGVDASNLQRLAKAQLVTIFLPLLAQKLSRHLVIQTLSAELASDPSLTEALVTNSALLSDPSNPGKSLLGSFLAPRQPGVSASYFASADQSGPILAAGTALTTDTADPSNPNANTAGTGSCHFAGYLQAPTDGPYRFFAELGNLGAQVTFRLDSPDPKALMSNPIIQATAAKDGDEVSQFVALKGGVAYHFALDFRSLAAKGASLLLQGENLQKGPLSQILLYPEQGVVGFNRANVLLSKVLQILQVTGLDEREVGYMTAPANAPQFNNLNLGALPTQASDDSVAKAIVLFSQFLTLADYADLRKGPAGGTDGLVDVFEAASQISPPTPPSTLLANLTRRDSQVVQDVATALGADPHFLNNVGIRRMWDALQLVQIVRLPVKSLSDATAIVTPNPTAPDKIAANFKNAVKAQYTPDQWRPIAQSVFDPLRRRKRDALVSFLVSLPALGINSSNQLFEYFLVDPGMEPVVQTSRLRLAMSSLQTFVQRCLLNLENGYTTQPERNVAPNAIRADWWEWMHRYRVWQANREIFLFPENWMEPELRLDTTDLFKALESTLLQGDVNNDLAESAFLTYLQGLDVRARLDIVATYLDQNLTDPGSTILHVLGRTFGHPHKYFYRTYESGTWSGWVAVTPDIEGDHVALAIWRGRLNIFWLTFVLKAQAPTPSSGNDPTGVGGLGFDALTTDIFTGKPQKQVQVQLHWVEYFQGKWSNRISTDVAKSDEIDVLDTFDPSYRDVHIHVTKEVDSSGNEGAVKIHVDFPDYGSVFSYLSQLLSSIPVNNPAYAQIQGLANQYRTWASRTFRVTSKNCDPDFKPEYWEPAQIIPYTTAANASLSPGPTFYTGSDILKSSFQSNIQSTGTSTPSTEPILGTANNFEVLTCSNPISPSPFIPSSDPVYWEVGGLVGPFFYKDTSNLNAGNQLSFLDERTFFVQPSLTETVIDQWPGWALGPSTPSVNYTGPVFLNNINVQAQVPVAGPVPVNPGDPVYSIFPMQNSADWLTSPGVAISYGGASIGKSGGIPTTGFPSLASMEGTAGVSGALAVIGAQGLSLTNLRGANLGQSALSVANLTALLQQKKS